MKSWIDLDARGLEPPLPMVRILGAASALLADTGIVARTDRRPVFLFDELELRGFSARCELAPDGAGYVTHIERLKVSPFASR